MNIKSYISVLCLTLVVEIIMANNIRLKRSPQQKYCGSRLADMLKILCKGKYNERKRSQMGKFVESSRILIIKNIPI